MELAKSNSETASESARRNDDENIRYDEVWCVFDRDDHERFDDACQMARGNGFKLAVSNPSFELWLLLHFRDNPGRQHRDKINEMLRKVILSYDKRIDFGVFINGLHHAAIRAKRIHDNALQDGEKEFDNPSSSMFKLVGSMLKELSSQEPFKNWVWLQQTLAQ